MWLLQFVFYIVYEHWYDLCIELIQESSDNEYHHLF